MKALHLFLCLISLFFLTGCWNTNEVNRISIVFGIGIDQLENGEYELTLQIVSPSRPAQGTAGGQGNHNFITLSKSGKTVADIIANLISVVPRHVYFGHTKMLVFGETVSKHGVKDIIDWFERYREIRFPFVFTTVGKAKDILSANFPLEQIPGVGMQHLISYRYHRFAKLTPTLNQFSENSFTPSKVSYATYLGVKNKPDKKLEIMGLSFFKDGKLFFTANNDQVIDYLFFRKENVKGGSFLIPCKDKPQKYTTFDLDQKKTKIKPEIRDHELIYHITIETDGSIASTNCGEKIFNQEKIETLEKDLINVIKKRMTKLVNLAQKKYKIDFLGFERELMRHNLSYWKEIEDQWGEIFPTIKVEINVNSHIRRVSGATFDPILEDN